MPFRSEAQRRKMYSLEEQGKLPKGTAARWEKETGDKKLPERVSTSKKASFYLKVAQDLGQLHALKEAGLDKTALLEGVGKWLVEDAAPIWAPAVAGSILAGPDRRVEGAVAGGVGGLVLNPAIARKLAPYMGMSTEARQLLEAYKGKIRDAWKAANKAKNVNVAKDIESAHNRAKWVGRGIGAGVGGLGIRYFGAPGESHPSLAGMPEANYDVGSHYYSGVLPEEEQYSYGLW